MILFIESSRSEKNYNNINQKSSSLRWNGEGFTLFLVLTPVPRGLKKHCFTQGTKKLFFCLFFLPFLGLSRHMEVPRLGVELELQPPAYARATATRDPSRVCNLHHSSWQRWTLNPLSKARD